MRSQMFETILLSYPSNCDMLSYMYSHYHNESP